MDIAKKTALIAGAGSGLGAATARCLAQQGAKVIVVDNQPEAAKRLAAEIGGMAWVADVSDAVAMEQRFNQWAKQGELLHICVNCAGIAPAKRIVNRDGIPMPLSDFEQVIQINLLGTFNVMRLAASQMISQSSMNNEEERGIIINTASVAAYEGQIGQTSYSASKGGIVAMTLPAARELAPWNIRVMTIAPGVMDTPMMANMPEKVRQQLAQTIPFPKRFGMSSEYAYLVLNIIKNPYLNGSVIRLDAGLRMTA